MSGRTLLLLLSLGCGEATDGGTASTASTASTDLVHGLTTAAVDPKPPGAGGACEQQPAVNWDSWAQGFFRGYCTACHSRAVQDRWGAPEGIDFDTEADVYSLRLQIQSAVLDTNRMPVGGGVLEEDLMLLQIYLSCGL